MTVGSARLVVLVLVAWAVPAACTSGSPPPSPAHATLSSEAAPTGEAARPVEPALSATNARPEATASATETAVPAEPTAPAARPEQAPAGTQPTGGSLVNEKGCVTDAFRHAARILLEKDGKELSERLGRTVELSDFTADAADRGKLFLSRSSLPDLDGDGAQELELTDPYWGIHVWPHVLYFSNHGCLRFAHELVNSELTPLPTTHGGVRDLEATAANGCAGLDFTWTLYRWNGKAYGVADQASCWLCPDASISTPPPGANRHPHCQRRARALAAGATGAQGGGP